jgi:6-phosphofructokinase 1
LGHMQRGGAPSAKDRILASQMGYFAAENISNLSKLSFVSKVKSEIKLFEYDKTPKKENSHNKEFSQLISVLSK